MLAGTADHRIHRSTAFTVYTNPVVVAGFDYKSRSRQGRGVFIYFYLSYFLVEPFPSQPVA